jgi:hypothetical protein
MHRAFIWVIAATFLVTALALTPLAWACIEDSVGLELVDGELPGGG